MITHSYRTPIKRTLKLIRIYKSLFMEEDQIPNSFQQAISKAKRPRALPKGIHSELHELVANLRQQFQETATKGAGSFGYYLWHLKRVPIHVIYRWISMLKESRDLVTAESKRRVFWWYYRQWKKKVDNSHS